MYLVSSIHHVSRRWRLIILADSKKNVWNDIYEKLFKSNFNLKLTTVYDLKMGLANGNN